MNVQLGPRLAGGILLGIVLMTGAGIGLASNASAQATYEITPRDPEFLYDRACGYCHGHNVGPLIRGRQLPAAVVAAIVRSGNGAMPAFRPTEITNAELTALAQWIEQSEADPAEHGQ